MDLSIHRVQVINQYKKQQLLNTLILYSLTALACILFCSSPFWYPSLKKFLSVSFLEIASFFFSAKVLFIIGNLIVIFLIGESKKFTSVSSPASYFGEDDHVEIKGGRKLEKYFEKKSKNTCKDEGDKEVFEKGIKIEVEKGIKQGLNGEGISLPAEQLSKMADDFIAKVNKQRRLEAVLFST